MTDRMVEYVGWKDPIGEGLYNMGVTDERIIRCRDCAFGHQHDGKRFPKECKGMWYCVAWSDGMHGEWTIPDGYCHKAEPRKEQA